VFGRAKAQILEKRPSVLLFWRGQNRLVKDRLLGRCDELWSIAALAISRALSS